MEDELAEYQQRCGELSDKVATLESAIYDIGEYVKELEDKLEWITTTYPDLEVAFEVKRRLDAAT
jgi:phage shock protein A